MSKEGLLIVLLESERNLTEIYKSKFDNAEIEETKKYFHELRGKFSRLKINEIRKRFYKKEKIEQYFKELEKKNISKKEEKKVKKYREKQEKNEQYLKQLKENLNKSKKYYDYDDRDYKGIRDIENLFGEVHEEDYYKPVKTKSAFHGNYTEYGSEGTERIEIKI